VVATIGALVKPDFGVTTFGCPDDGVYVSGVFDAAAE